MMDDARYADEDFVDEDSPQEIDKRFALAKSALAIKHQQIDPSSALRHVLNRAHDDAVAALVGLIEVDPGDAKAVRDLQWQVSRYDAMCQYIDEVLSAGEEAEDALTAEQAERLSDLTENMLNSEPVDD